MKRSEKAGAILRVVKRSLDLARRDVSTSQIDLAGYKAQAAAYKKDSMNALDEDHQYAPAADRERTRLEKERERESEWAEVYDFATGVFLEMLDEPAIPEEQENNDPVCPGCSEINGTEGAALVRHLPPLCKTLAELESEEEEQDAT